MTVESITPNGLKKSVLDSEYKTEYDENLDLLDENIGYLSALARINLLSNSGFGAFSNSEGLYDTSTDALPVLGTGSDIIANGTFATDTDWTKQTGWSISPGEGVASVVAGWNVIHQSIATILGQRYQVKYSVTMAGSGSIRSTFGTSKGAVRSATGIGTYTDVFIGTGGSVAIGIEGNGLTCNIDNVSCHKVMPGIISPTSSGPDGWENRNSAGIKIYQHYEAAKGTLYAVKLVTTQTNWNLRWPKNSTELLLLAKYAGRTVTFGIWAKCSIANAVKLAIYDGSNTYSSYHTGSGNYELLTVTKAISPSASEIQFQIDSQSANTSYWRSPMLVIGTKISEENYVPGEGVVHLEKPITLSNYNGAPVSANATINLESESSGKMPKGCKAVKVRTTGTPTATDKYLALKASSTGSEGPRIDSLIASKAHTSVAWCPVASDGTIQISTDGTFTTTIVISAIEV